MQRSVLMKNLIEADLINFRFNGVYSLDDCNGNVADNRVGIRSI